MLFKLKSNIFILIRNAEELALYDSLDEGHECVLCRSNVDDVINFGKKLTIGTVTAHHFCVVS